MPERDALARCVGDPERFLEERWEQAVHLHHGADIGGLLDLDDVDALLADSALRAPAFRLVKQGTPLPQERYVRRARVGSRTITDLIDPGRVHALFADGATVVLQGLQRYWPPLTAFCRQLEQTLGHPVQANAYLTPPAATGLRVHRDAHDVLALQTHGSKHWVAYPGDADLGSLPAPVLDTMVEVGDCLYLPRGTPHAARTPDTASLHITIGIRVTTWRDLLRRAVDRALADPTFDAALPPGHTADPAGVAAALSGHLATLAGRLGEADAQGIAHAAADSFVRGRQPALRGQLRELLEVDAVDDATVLRRRPGTLARLRADGDGARLLLGDRDVLLPEAAAPAVSWILEQERFKVADLGAFLDEPGRLVLARRLVREGLLVRRG